MNAMAYDRATVGVLWRRDLRRFWRQPSRIVGALGQPIIFWLVIGSGMAATFKLPGQSIGYMEYFFPGVVLMVALFASIFASVSVIEDRHQGFLQAVLAGPGSRTALVLGKALGSASVALLQVGLFLLLAPLAGFALGTVQWPLLLASLAAMSIGLSAFGFAMAWLLDNTQAYHAIQMTFLVPLWVVSGAMFPPDPNNQVFQWMMRLNPVAYGVTCVRQAFYSGNAPTATVLDVGPLTGLVVLVVFAAASLSFAGYVCRRR